MLKAKEENSQMTVDQKMRIAFKKNRKSRRNGCGLWKEIVLSYLFNRLVPFLFTNAFREEFLNSQKAEAQVRRLAKRDGSYRKLV